MAIKRDPPVPSMSFPPRLATTNPSKIMLNKMVSGSRWIVRRALRPIVPSHFPLTLSLPRNTPFTLRLSLPVGVKLTQDSKESLEGQSYTIVQTDEELTISGRSGNKTITRINPVISAQLKGRLSGGAHTLETDSTIEPSTPSMDNKVSPTNWGNH